ncbi:M56 family metallopeptidase [Chitinophaga sp. MM2321]|uniref:M56 family metallopeptidase n=1 Tax=Chitinophaga sp. MM2321 TaxID=3137178 RepID=UPI0032D56B0E
MPTLFIYILQASGAMILFYLLYILCFKQETFYRYNRILLLSAFFLSALLPLLPIPALQWAAHTPEEVSNTIVYFNNNVQAPTQSMAAPATHPWWDALVQHSTPILLSIYIVVAIGLLLAHVVPLWKIRRCRLAGSSYRKNNITYVQLPGLTTPFSFMRAIFFDPNAYEHTELQHILKHEEAHVQQYHSIDTLLAAVYCCICWINPFAWWCKKALQLNLEFLADEAALQHSTTPASYQYSLLKIGAHCSPVSVVSHFSKSFLKNRIFMMNKTHSPHVHAWKYLLALPVLALAACLLSATSSSTNTARNKYLVEDMGITYGMVTKLTSDDDLAGMKEILAKKGITVTLPLLKRNQTGEITEIKFDLALQKGSSLSMRSDDSPITPFYFNLSEKENGIGVFPTKHFPQSLIARAEDENNGELKGVTTDTSYKNRFPGGSLAYQKTLSKTIRYPRAAQEKKAIGIVTVQYKIQADGIIKDIEALSSPDQQMTDEVKRVIANLPPFNADPTGKTTRVTLRVAYLLIDRNDQTPQVPGLKDADVIVYGYGVMTK